MLSGQINGLAIIRAKVKKPKYQPYITGRTSLEGFYLKEIEPTFYLFITVSQEASSAGVLHQ